MADTPVKRLGFNIVLTVLIGGVVLVFAWMGVNITRDMLGDPTAPPTADATSPGGREAAVSTTPAGVAQTQ
jgi:hypothetical protein